jgi:fructose transport system substrate-binding protein
MGTLTKRRSAAVATATLVLALVTVLAVATSASGAEAIKIGLITKTETNPFFVKMKEGAQKAAKQHGAELLTAAGKFDGDTSSEITAIENMTTAGVKAILITPSSKAVVPALLKAKRSGVMIVALDTPTDPASAADVLYATNNFTAGVLIGKYAKAVFGQRQAKIATLDLFPRPPVDLLRHNGFLNGFGNANAKASSKSFVNDARVVCSQDTSGNQAKGQTAMENCLQKAPDLNLVYTINEPAAAGAYRALKAAGKEKSVTVVSVDGGCEGVRNVRKGIITATSQQYPLKMASLGVKAGVDFAKTGKKVTGYVDTGVTLITAKPREGVPAKNVAFGLANCWG